MRNNGGNFWMRFVALSNNCPSIYQQTILKYPGASDEEPLDLLDDLENGRMDILLNPWNGYQSPGVK